ncbi:unnamed protein product [Spirodela intermedia]|uniref:Uncharacterized protein n=1 Tax=Spirodela intermedia TaxID=51605 RepID=A0A7I8IVC3_SPIIN|nr:unnamed protein product [Spirodela intermedia]CAA6661523.1 unnamed protein product [Spirodela intermedia]
MLAGLPDKKSQLPRLRSSKWGGGAVLSPAATLPPPLPHFTGGGRKKMEESGEGEGMWEIEEVGSAGGGESRRRELQGGGGGEGGSDLYVAVGKGSSSMGALSWALKHVAKPKDFVYLIHVYPEVRNIPTPLTTKEGRERERERERVIMDTLLIESDLIANAIVELIPVLHIRRLFMGISKSNIRAMRKGAGKSGQVLRNAPEYCQVTVISEGGEVRASTTDDYTAAAAPPPTPPTPPPETARKGDDSGGAERLDEPRSSDMAICVCFPRKFL